MPQRTHSSTQSFKEGTFKHPTNPKPTHSRNVQVRTCPFPFSLFPVLGNTQKLATWSCSPIPGFPPGSLTDIWVVSTSWLLWLVLLWPFVCKFLCRHMFSFLLGMNLGVELLGHMVTQCLVMSGPARLFLLWLHHFTPPPTLRFPLSPHPQRSRIWSGIYLTMLSIYKSLMVSDGEHLSMCPLTICISFLEKSVQILCLFFNWIVCFY